MLKLGFLGGTFNPIHNGHLALAEAAYRQLNLDKVLIISSGKSYLKKDIVMPSKEERLYMTELACEDISYFESSDIECKKEGNTYTAETLADLKVIYPDSEIYFIIGADTLFSIETWKQPDVIMKLATLAVSVRDEYITDDLLKKKQELENRFNAKILLLNMNKIDISSSMIRENLCKDSSIKNLLPSKVYEYIKENHLYGL